MPELKNMAHETAKIARVTIPRKGYESTIAKSDGTGFVNWLKYASEWNRISEQQFEYYLDLFMEAHEKILLSGNNIRREIFYSKISTLSALGIDKALYKIKLQFVKILGT